MNFNLQGIIICWNIQTKKIITTIVTASVYLCALYILQYIYVHINRYLRCRKNFYTCLQIFNHNPESNEDINLAHIVPKIKPPEPLNDPLAAIVFQPTAWASPAHTKTNRWRVDRLGALEVWFLAQCVPNGCLHWILGYG